MAARYIKTIPEKIYFYEVADGWLAGPFVNPPHGHESNMIVCKIIREIPEKKPSCQDLLLKYRQSECSRRQKNKNCNKCPQYKIEE